MAVDVGVGAELLDQVDRLQRARRARRSRGVQGCGGRVLTASAGIHGLGIAYAATRLEAAATIAVPKTASPAKIEALCRYGVDLVLHGRTYEDAERHALALASAAGTFVSAYNDRHVIVGQATIVAELVEHVAGAMTNVVPGRCRRAGIGVSRAAQHHGTCTTVMGVEATTSRAVSAAVATGQISTVDAGSSLADGLAGNIGADSITPYLCGRPARWSQPSTNRRSTKLSLNWRLRPGSSSKGPEPWNAQLLRLGLMQ